MTTGHLKTLVIIILSSFLILGYISENNTRAISNNSGNMSVTETIKLYSNGKLIGQWEGIGKGQMKGETYSFKTEHGSFSEKVTISGNFIIETHPN